MANNSTLIVGAGPTGLSAAIFLAQRNLSARLIEKRSTPQPFSKAFGINARTLELLESSGVTRTLLDRGWRLEAFNLYHESKQLIRLDFESVDHRFPFMLIHPQNETEAVMEEAALKCGITVERGVELEDLKLLDGSAEVSVSGSSKTDGERYETVFAADGASSTVRKNLGISFDGEAFEEPWYLFDVELDTSLAPREAHAFMLPDGALFMVRLRDRLWRVLGNVPEMLQRLPTDTTAGKIEWQSDFGISHRLASTMAKGAVLLGGDAAHIHSGLGARGMNLGIEDSFVFAELKARGRLSDYDQVRRPVVTRVMDAVQHLTEVPRGRSLLSKAARKVSFLIPHLAPIVKKRAEPWILGLDHPVELESP